MPDNATLIGAISALWLVVTSMAAYIARDKDNQLKEAKNDIKDLRDQLETERKSRAEDQTKATERLTEGALRVYRAVDDLSEARRDLQGRASRRTQ